MNSLGALLVLVASACNVEEGEAGPPPSCEDIASDASPEIEIVVRDADGSSRVAADMEPIALVLPPQGGKVLLVAPRVRNMDACSMRVTASLRDECTNRIVGLETRPLKFAPGSDGWAEPVNPHLVSNWSNVPVCPSAGAERDIEGEPYMLTITVEDGHGRTVSASRRIVPTCADDDQLERCLCECDANYVLGESCAPDDDSSVTEGCS